MQNNLNLNKLDATWRRKAPGGMRPKITRIPFMGEINNNLRAMGTKRVGVMPNSLFRRVDTGMLDMANMKQTTASFAPFSSVPESYTNNPSYDNEINPNYYKDPIQQSISPYQNMAPQSSPDVGMPTRPPVDRLHLQQELADLKRERLGDYRELQDLRERDLVRKRFGDQRKTYRAYILDTSKETRGWLREGTGIKNSIRDTRGMFE